MSIEPKLKLSDVLHPEDKILCERLDNLERQVKQNTDHILMITDEIIKLTSILKARL